MKTNTHLRSHPHHRFSECEIFYTEVVEKIKKEIICSINFSQQSCHLRNNVQKLWYSQAGHSSQYNMAHALCMLDD